MTAAKGSADISERDGGDESPTQASGRVSELSEEIGIGDLVESTECSSESVQSPQHGKYNTTETACYELM